MNNQIRSEVALESDTIQLQSPDDVQRDSVVEVKPSSPYDAFVKPLVEQPDAVGTALVGLAIAVAFVRKAIKSPYPWLQDREHDD